MFRLLRCDGLLFIGLCAGWWFVLGFVVVFGSRCRLCCLMYSLLVCVAVGWVSIVFLAFVFAGWVLFVPVALWGWVGLGFYSVLVCIPLLFFAMGVGCYYFFLCVLLLIVVGFALLFGWLRVLLVRVSLVSASGTEFTAL